MAFQWTMASILGPRLEESFSAEATATAKCQQTRRQDHTPRVRWKAASIAAVLAIVALQGSSRLQPRFGDCAAESVAGGIGQERWCRLRTPTDETACSPRKRARAKTGTESLECQAQGKKESGEFAKADCQKRTGFQRMETGHQEHSARRGTEACRDGGQTQEGPREGRRGNQQGRGCQCRRRNGLCRRHLGRRSPRQEAFLGSPRSQDGRVKEDAKEHGGKMLAAGIEQPAAVRSDVCAFSQSKCARPGDNVTSDAIFPYDQFALQGHPGQHAAIQAQGQEGKSGSICIAGHWGFEGDLEEWLGTNGTNDTGTTGARSSRCGYSRSRALGTVKCSERFNRVNSDSVGCGGLHYIQSVSWQTSSRMSANHHAVGQPDANLSMDFPWWCTGSCDFNNRQPLHWEILDAFYQLYFATAGFLSSLSALRFHDLPDGIQMIAILAMFLTGWSLILIALYFPWQDRQDWLLLKIRKRRHFVRGFSFVNAYGKKTLWRLTSMRKGLHTSLKWRWRLTWCFLGMLIFPTEAMQNMQSLQSPLDVFTPPAWDSAAASSSATGGDFNPFKDVVVHRLDQVPDYLRMPTSQPPWRVRSFIGRQLGLEKKEHYWENFNIFPVQPHPNGQRTLTELHYLLELPNDKMPSESILLVEKRQFKPAIYIQRFAWRLQTSIRRNEVLDEIGSKFECGENYADCLVFLLGELWPETDTSLRVVPNGALLKVIYSLEQELEQESSSYGSCPSESLQPHVDDPGSGAETIDYSDDSCLMQRSIQQVAQRNAEDHVFRLLSGRLAVRHLPEGYGYTVSLWAARENNVPQTLETRVWLDPRAPSWESNCVQAIEAHIPGLQGRHARWLYYVAIPSPFTERIPGNNMQLLCTPETLQEVSALLLIDIFEAQNLRRVAIALVDATSVFSLARILIDARVEELHRVSFQLSWHTREGNLILLDHDIIRFPLGAYVRLSRVARPRNDDECTLLQKTPSNLKLSTAFRPYGHRDVTQSYDDSFPLSLSEGQPFAPATSLTVILWSYFCSTCRRPLTQETSFLVRDEDLRLSFHREPTEGLCPPGNPDAVTSFFDTLDEVDINEGVPISIPGKRVTLQLEELLPGIPTPVRNHQSAPLGPRHMITPCPQHPECSEQQGHDDVPDEYLVSHLEEPYTRTITLDTKAESEIFEEILFFHPELHRLHQEWPPADVCHPATLDWLAEHQILDFDTFDPHEFETITVHTDGSYNGENAAWCFVVTLRTPENHHAMLGFAAAKVVLSAQEAEFAGTTRLGASQAETEALHWASWWVLRFLVTHTWTGQLEFFWDAQVSGHKAMGLANSMTNKVNGPTAARLRAFQHALTQYLGPQNVLHAHTKAHSGDPLNELADVVSKLANEQQKSWNTAFPAPCQIELLSPYAFDLLWYYVSQQQSYKDLPPMDDGTISWTTTSAPATRDAEKIKQWSSMISPFLNAAEQPNQQIHFSLIFGSYNVLSLGDRLEQAKTLLDEPGRVALLRQQVHAQRIHCMGLQEARTPKGAYHSMTHFRFSSGPLQNGVGGVELWFSKAWPYGRTDGGCTLVFQEEHFHLLHCEPSLLVMKVATTSLQLLVGVAHAPHSGHSKQHIEDWWTRLRQTLDRLHEKRELVLLMDANAKTDATEDMAFGGLSEDVQNSNGLELRAFANESGLCAPASFAHIQYGKLATWTHPGTGKESRLDYILCPQSWLQCSLATWVEDACDTGHAIPDHACTCLQVEWSEWTRFKPSTSVPFDIRKIRQKSSAPILADILENAPHFDWEVNANEHAHELVQWLHGELAQAFPKSASSKRKINFASEETLLAHSQLVTFKRQCRAIIKMLRLLNMRKAFYDWAGLCLHLNTRQWHHVLRLKLCRLKCEMGHCAHQLRLQLRRDRQDFVQQIACEANRAEPSEIFKKLSPILVNTKKQGARHKTVPRLKKADGSYTTSREEMNELWLNHFAALEAGTVMKPEEFFLQAIQEQPNNIMPTSWSASDLPQLGWIEHAVRKLQSGKAPGPDLITNEVLKSNPGAAARVLLPLMWKMVLRLQEPVIWKGGRLLPIYKKKGSHEECNSFRGILLMDCMGKVLRSASRHLVAAPFFHKSDPMQMGGEPGMPVQFGSQAVRAFQGYAKAQTLSSSLIFADVQSAYYRAIRELATGHTDEVSLQQIIHRFRLDEDAARTLQTTLHHAGGQEQLGGSALQVTEGLSHTWFSCSGQETVKTERGTRPGDSWADVTFAVIMNSVLQRIKTKMTTAGILVTFPKYSNKSVFEAKPTDEMVEVFNICWADDLAVLVLSECAASLPEKTSTATFIMVSTFNEFGMDLTIGEGKTAIIMIPRGPAAVKVRRQFFGKPKAHLPVILENNMIRVPLVYEYRHLGGQITAASGLLPELKSRATKARSAFWRAARAVFKSKYLDLQTRKRLFQACVMSIWFWGCGSWPAMTQGESKFFVTTTWQLWSLLLPRHPPDADHWTHAMIQESLDDSSPLCHLHEARLRHLGSMIRHGPQVLWSLVLSDEKMRQPLEDALGWTWQALPTLGEWQGWQDLITSNPDRWKHLVLLASLRHKRYELRQNQTCRWHAEIYQHFVDENLVMNDSRESTSTMDYCIMCKRSFSNRRGWFLHAFTKHGYRSQPGQNAVGDTCFICHKQYPSTASLQNHLRYSSRCNTAFALRRHELVQNPPLEAKHRQCPWRYVQSDVVIALTDDPIDFELEALQSHLSQILHNFETEHALQRDPALLAGALEDGLSCALPFSRILEGFRSWVESCRPVDYVVESAVSFVWQWLDSLAPSYIPAESSGKFQDEAHRKILRMKVVDPRVWAVRPTELYFLHFFSGRRRRGDLQEAIERIPLPSNTVLWVLSLDLQICPRRCNLMCPKQQAQWSVAGSCAGPPCETWSIARWMPPAIPLHHGMRPPRPIRSRDEPWGLLRSSAKEHEQLTVGSLYWLPCGKDWWVVLRW